MQIAHSGVELAVSQNDAGSQTITVSRKGTDAVTFSVAGSTASTSRRSRAADTASNKMDFDRQVAALSEWFDQTEGLLELVTSEPNNAQDQLTLEEQLVLIEVFHPGG